MGLGTTEAGYYLLKRGTWVGYEISSTEIEMMEFRGRAENHENLRGTIGYLL